MKELDWFVKTLECEFKVEVDKDRISYEGNELYLDEIDESLIPSEMLHDLPESLLFETMVFDHEDGTGWLGVVAIDVGTREWYLQVILKDGEPVLRKNRKGELSMTRYHKIIMNGDLQYRGFNEATGFYEDGTLSEGELIEQLLEEAVDEVIEIDKGQVERAISFIPNIHQRELVQNYIDYLEYLVESLE